MDIRYEVGQLFKLAFGIESPVYLTYPNEISTKQAIGYNPEGQNSPSPGISYTDIQFKPAEEASRLSWMGTPIIYPLTFKGGTYKTFNKASDIIDYSIDDFELPAATLVTFIQDKKNPRTSMPGNLGSVKEFYSFDDWEIRIRGICLDDASRNTCKTAKEQKVELLKWNRICSAIDVVGELFFERDISALSLGPITWTTLEGKPNVFPFEIACYSDNRNELVL